MIQPRLTMMASHVRSISSSWPKSKRLSSEILRAVTHDVAQRFEREKAADGRPPSAAWKETTENRKKLRVTAKSAGGRPARTRLEQHGVDPLPRHSELEHARATCSASEHRADRLRHWSMDASTCTRYEPV